MNELIVNSEDPDQTSHVAASNLGLHCLPPTHLPTYVCVSSLQRVKQMFPVRAISLGGVPIYLKQLNIQIIVFLASCAVELYLFSLVTSLTCSDLISR